jgi:hypothetical protein
MDGRHVSLAILVAMGSACSGDDRRPGAASIDPSGVAVSGIDDVGDETSDEERLDLGGADTGSEVRDGCNYVDVLFVIDNSGSMCLAQEGLAAVLPDLVDAMFDALPADTDVHVGLTTTTFAVGGQHLESMCWAHETDAEVDDYYVAPSDPNDGNGYQGRLYEHDGRKFFAGNTSTDSDRDDLRAWFPAAATAIGCSGGAFEFAAGAAGFALSDANAATNAGFVRDEGGVLVVFVLSDGIDLTPDDSLDIHRDAVLAAKAGCGSECIVTAGLLNAHCVPESDPMVWRFLDSFDRPTIWGDIKDPAGYAAVVETAMGSAIVETCEEIPPAG